MPRSLLTQFRQHAALMLPLMRCWLVVTSQSSAMREIMVGVVRGRCKASFIRTWILSIKDLRGVASGCVGVRTRIEPLTLR